MTVTKPMVIRLLAAAVGLLVTLFLLVVVGYYAAFYVSPRANGTLSSSGLLREYLLHVPATYDAGQPVPLVISLHAAAMWPGSQMAISGWNQVAEENGFLVVYPSGRTLAGGGVGLRPKVWHASEEALALDVRFLADLIDTLSAHYRIDPDRVYANGFSNGGRMAFTLSCMVADRVAAVGVVAGAQDLPWGSCSDAPPVPMIAFHGLADPLASYGGREPSWLSARPLPSVRAWTAAWAARNGCHAPPSESDLGTDVHRTVYADCQDGADVVLYAIDGGGHTWPGGKVLPEWLLGPTTSSVRATAEMWSFFAAHPRGSH